MTPTGRIERVVFSSDVLRGNPCGDPVVRTVPVYLPPGYDDAPSARFPVVFCLTGFTGRGVMLLNEDGWAPNIAQRMDLLIASGRARPMILVMPDCFTRYGGSQYINSAATGRYEDHLVSELVPWADRTYRTRPDRRGLMGKSSGGFGAITQVMRHPELFHAVACHSGDMYFEYCYLPDFPKFLNGIREAGGVAAFLHRFDESPRKKSEDLAVLNILAMAACYSPDPSRELRIGLPFDLETGRVDEAVWRRWLEWDPVRALSRSEQALRSLRLLFLDCGTRDEWNLHFGARMFARELSSRGIPFRHEEFNDGHMQITYRYDVSLPLLSEALSA
jgi:enterochelin esterase family protein